MPQFIESIFHSNKKNSSVIKHDVIEFSESLAVEKMDFFLTQF